MQAMVLHKAGEALRSEVREPPTPGAGQALIEVAACGVCRTDLHIVDGELAEARFPIVPGHEIVGTVSAASSASRSASVSACPGSAGRAGFAPTA